MKTKNKIISRINKSKSLFFGFTLVELIVVIVILAILATIAFLSFNSYSGNSRDSVRLADVSNLNKGIELFNIKSGYYPSPEGTISTGTIFGVELTYKGIIKDGITRMVNINKTPVDPLSSSNYVYGITFDKKYFQIGVVLENSANKTGFVDLFDSALAGSGAGNYFSKINGNYMGIIKFSTGITNKYYYVANVPSLLYNNMTADLLNTGTYYIADDNTNLAYQIDPNVTINNKTADVIIKDVTNKTTATLTGVDITDIINGVNTVTGTFNTGTLNQIGYDIGTLSNAITVGQQIFGNGVCPQGYIVSGNGCAHEGKTSCLSWLNAGSNTSGVYWIDPDGNGTTYDAKQLYCDMTTNGGGRTMVVGIDAANKNHGNALEVTPENLTSLNGKGKVSDAYINAIQNNGNHQLRLQSTSYECPYYNSIGDTFTNCNFHSDQRSANGGAGCSLGNQGGWSTSAYGLNDTYANARGVVYLLNSPSRNGLHETRVSGQYRSKPGILWAR